MEMDKVIATIQDKTIVKAELLLTEWKEPASGDEKSFILAIRQTPINKSTVEDLKQVLRLAMIKVGLRAQNFPSDIEKVVLIEHIMTEYGRHTPAEVKLAFDMAIAGKLDLLEKEITCYENFSCLYLSKILNAYRRWASEAYSTLKKENTMSITQELEPMEMIDWIEEWKKKPDIIVDLIPLSFYDFLTTTEQIYVNDEMKWDYWDKAIQAIKTELNMAIPACRTTDASKAFTEFESMYADKKYTAKMKDRISNKAKKLIVFDYFRKK